jgi:hypothetical protein
MDRLGLDGLTTGGLTPHRESYEHLGEVIVWIADMSSVWAARRGAASEPFGPVLLDASIEIAAPPPIVWASLTRPDHLQMLLGATRVGFGSLSGGRLSAGSEVHCYHGEGTPQVMKITEWSPFTRLLVRFSIPIPVLGTVHGACEYLLDETDTGTVLRQRMTRPDGPLLARSLATVMLRRVDRNTMNDMRRFKAVVEERPALRIALEPVATPTVEQVRDAVRNSLTSQPA